MDTWPFGNDDVVTTGEVELIGNVKGLVASTLVESLTSMVKLNVPGVVGDPERTPADDNVSPGGRVLEVASDHVYGLTPPVAANVWLYVDAREPPVSGLDVVIVSVGTATVS
jgi:hypothetical protein